MVLRRLRAAAVFLLCLAPAAAAVAAPAEEEYEIKAAFLYHFAQFTSWPEDAVDAQKPFVIGILGRDPFGAELDALRGETVHGRPIRVSRMKSLDEAGAADLLFISPSEKDRLDDILRRLHGRRVLTVGESEGFVEKGGIILFSRLGNKIRFEINKKSADEAGLKISSQLLSLAKDVVS